MSSRQELIAAAKAPTIAYNEKDWDAVRSAITPDFVYDEVATNRKAEGLEDVVEVWKGWARAMPDSKATFEDPIVENDTVIIRMTWTGTHTGPLTLPDGEVPATGKPVVFRSCQFYRVKNGKAVSMRQYFDMFTILSQLGIATVNMEGAAVS